MMECVTKFAQKNEFQTYSDHSALYPTVCSEGVGEWGIT